ncbi:MAG TPA: cupin domain-containing protein [Chloroflexota bacterium]|jgi:mannose-6-phosphate isomerase-like protein (cupin superfamily)
MAETEVRPLDWSREKLDDRVSGDSNYAGKQRLHTKGWQVVSIADAVQQNDNKFSYVALTDNRYAKVAMNVYQPGQKDEMHCHPGSEHLFMVMQGELHIRGLDNAEDVVLKPGEFVHINQSYYYQLANETNAVTVLYQVATKPAKPPKVHRYSYRGPNDVDPASLEG